MTSHRWVTLAAAALGAMMLVYGAWAFVAPHSFYYLIGPFKPYNEHYTHDAGALQIGLGIALVFAATGRSALTTALGAFASFAGLHLVSHLEDLHRGGVPERDIPYLAVMVVVGAGALTNHIRGDR